MEITDTDKVSRHRLILSMLKKVAVYEAVVKRAF